MPIDQAKLHDIEREVDKLTDLLDEKVDARIKPLVVALRYAGFPTTASCEGHLSRGEPFPWVDVASEDEQENAMLRLRMHEVLDKFNKVVATTEPFYSVDFVGFRLQPFPKLAYEAGELNISAEKLADMQEDVKELANFLLQKTEA